MQNSQQDPHKMSGDPFTWSLPWQPTFDNGEANLFAFSAENSGDRRLKLHQKRKSEVPVSIPPKQFISEEKITEHFNGLHISSDYVPNINAASSMPSGGVMNASQTGKCFTNLSYHDYQITARELEQKLRNAQGISMCEEAKKLHEEQKKVSFLPEALMHRTEKPCTALVLWQKPPIIEMLKQPQQVSQTVNSNRNILFNSIAAHDDDDFTEPDAEIDDFIDNNNSCSLDLNNPLSDSMEDEM